MDHSHRLLLFLLGSLFSCNVAPQPVGARRATDAPVTAEEPALRGEDLFAEHCTVCHGARGRGDGQAAPHLFPPARRFDAGRFRLVSSENGAPADADLVATLRRGIPGSAMPGFSWLPEADLAALAAHVRVLAEEGLALGLAERARSEGTPMPPAEARRLARERLTPDRPIVPVAEAAADVATLEQGRRVYVERCAQCHATDGTGERSPRYDEDGTLNWARDLTAGFLKGDASTRALACRIRGGIPGTAMPPNRIAPADEAALIVFVQSLIPPGVADRLVHVRSTLSAHKVAAVPRDPDDPAWTRAASIDVRLSPLWWNEEAVLAATLSALHDEDELALRLTWADSTGVVRLFTDTRATDAAALQFSASARPALFGMGAPHEPTNLWHWQALRMEDMAGALDLLDPVAHTGPPGKPGEVRADVPLYSRLLGRLEPSERADRIVVRGIDSVSGADRVPDEVHADAHWQDGRWSVVFRRALRPARAGLVAFVPESPVQVACAVWNGSAGDEGAKKSISIWQELVLER